MMTLRQETYRYGKRSRHFSGLKTKQILKSERMSKKGIK